MKNKKKLLIIIVIIISLLVVSFSFKINNNETILNKLDIVKTRYPGCDTDDITLPDGKQVWAACNVGATNASLYKLCDENIRKICPENIAGKLYRWGNNEPYETGSKIVSSTGANAWGGVTLDENLIQGPCAKGYHIPSLNEIKEAISIVIPEKYDPNNPWNPKDHKFIKDFREYLYMPYKTGYEGYYWGMSPIDYGDFGYFWTRELSYEGEHYPNKIKVGKYTVEIVESDQTKISKQAIPVRCIKNS